MCAPLGGALGSKKARRAVGRPQVPERGRTAVLGHIRGMLCGVRRDLTEGQRAMNRR